MCRKQVCPVARRSTALAEITGGAWSSSPGPVGETKKLRSSAIAEGDPDRPWDRDRATTTAVIASQGSVVPDGIFPDPPRVALLRLAPR